MGWEAIDQKVLKNENRRHSAVRMEVIRALKKDARVIPDRRTGVDDYMAFVRVGDDAGPMLGIEIRGVSSIGMWSQEEFFEPLNASGLSPLLKPYGRSADKSTTGRISSVDGVNRFKPVTLLNTKVRSADEAIKVIDIMDKAAIDWSGFWQGLIDEAKLSGLETSSENSFSLPIDNGSRLLLAAQGKVSKVSAKLIFDGEKAASQYKRALSLCGSVEGRFGSPLVWKVKDSGPEEFSVSHISSGHDLSDPTRWMEIYTYFMNAIEHFRETISDLERVGGE